MLYALGFIGLFTIRRHERSVPGGDRDSTCTCTDTYFVVAHFHYIMVGGTRHGLLGRPAFLVAEDHRTDVSGGWGRAAAIVIFFGFNLTFFPQFLLGYRGHAAALSRLCGAVRAAECTVLGGRIHPCVGLLIAFRLPDLVHAAGQTGR